MERPYRPLTEESLFRRGLRIAGYFFFYPLLFLTLIPLYSLRVGGRKRLGIRGGGITVMNHCIDMEWFFIWHAARPRYIRFVAEEANMKRIDAGWFNWIMGVIGVPEDRPMAVAAAVKAGLERGELVHFFPEGVIKRGNQNPTGFIIGAAWFACLNNVPLIPISEVLLKRPMHRFIPWWPPRVKLMVGEALYPEDFIRPGEKMRKGAARMTQEAERIIRDCILRGNEPGAPRQRSAKI